MIRRHANAGLSHEKLCELFDLSIEGVLAIQRGCICFVHQGGAKQMTDQILWCCHVRGPDDVHAAPDYETALKWADMTNALNWRGRGGKNEPPASYADCLLKAVPAIWPWSAEQHGKNMPKSIEDFSIPGEKRK